MDNTFIFLDATVLDDLEGGPPRRLAFIPAGEEPVALVHEFIEASRGRCR